MKRINKSNHQHAIAEMEICLYKKQFDNREMRLIAMDCNFHLALMHYWANQWYATKYWQMHPDNQSFLAYYKNKMNSNWENVLIVYLDNFPVSQIDIYQVNKVILSNFIETGQDDFGIHLLMAPYRQLIKHFGAETKRLSHRIIQCVLEYLFYNCKANAVFAEPDILNVPACRLAESTGFTFLRNIDLTYKTGKLYNYARDTFIEKYPAPKHVNYMNLFPDKGL
ncbi:GNAT family N-acetyltransferase [Arachidicoccus sp.]|uniref:GNAT family N-acetyltransferase n=1 Tax=Arachidicoccus sp. TaxID=1872624 RepID=UPI003D207B30